MHKHIPNFITLLNLLAGLLSIYFATTGNLQLAGLLVFVAAVFDFFDGFAARLLHAKSVIGVQLDSLADMVSFGVAPAFVLFYTIRELTGTGTPEYLPFTAFVVPLFSALRLAKFNVDDEQTTSFMGLPTPATGLLLASFPIMIMGCLTENKGIYYDIVTNPYFLASVGLISSALMVSNIPMFSLKSSSLSWTENQTRYLFIVLSVALLILLKVAAVPLIILLYLLLSIVSGLFKNNAASKKD
ncbi:MAG: CDP-diacylglycerol--serine O-phosphatidyltransferase [Bacteroidetes bacterium]|nr:MAG: CDP-diacylglycerol--serine O-phosphatidyltransferase [Bacteroidota bacterium]